MDGAIAKVTPHAFTSERVTVLKVIASQAASSLENSQIYRDVEDREGKIRRLVDDNIGDASGTSRVRSWGQRSVSAHAEMRP